MTLKALFKLFNMVTVVIDIFSIKFNIDLLDLIFLKITFNIESTCSDIYFNYICNFFFLSIVISHLCLFSIIF